MDAFIRSSAAKIGAETGDQSEGVSKVRYNVRFWPEADDRAVTDHEY